MAERSVAQAAWNWAFGHDRSIGFGLETLGHLTLRWPRVVAVFVLAFLAVPFGRRESRVRAG